MRVDSIINYLGKIMTFIGCLRSIFLLKGADL